MNRLVIIGNGFDLAHGLPTSYRNFIDDFWKNITSNYESELVKKIMNFDKPLVPFDNEQPLNDFNDFRNHLMNYPTGRTTSKFDNSNIELSWNSKPLFKFTNDFFKLINIKNSENWVDIENEYYQQLKGIVNKQTSNNEKKESVVKLNEEFEQVKELLVEYLNKEVNDKFNFDKQPTINWCFEYFSPYERNLQEFKAGNKYLNEFPKSDHIELIEYNNKFIQAKNDSTLPDKIDSGEFLRYNYFLNFNYTQTIDPYIKYLEKRVTIKQEQIQIHGRLSDKNNEINFGFGDEMDDEYKRIENFDDNEYLRNFKSFQYSQNSNYKTLLDYIDSDKYQVYIMGHSCGLSDRTLLNTVFEHQNCRSIKIFYHQKKDKDGEYIKNKNGEIIDNFTEIVQNISRHFDKKALMREKIVNKSLCVPLEQTVRFETIN